MFLLPLFTGILLVFQGPWHQVLGSRHSAATELDEYNQFLDKLSLYKKIIQAQDKREQEHKNKISDPHVDWANFPGDDNNQFEDVPVRDNNNFAAEETPMDEHVNINTDKATLNEAVDDPGTKHETTRSDPAKVTDGSPLPPEKQVGQKHTISAVTQSDFVFLTVVSACSVAGLVGLIMAGVCWYKLHKRVKAASDVDYPAYGVTGPTKERLPSPGDRKLAQSAQMYHYQHQKQQMIAMEKANGEMKHDASEDESEEENEEGDYTVYECPGLAPTGEMEVRNPLFTEDAQTPVNGQSTTVNGLPDDHEQE